jgi:hypothetical protein
MCVGLVLFAFAMLLLWWYRLDRGDEWMVQPGARYGMEDIGARD